ncbi:MAG: radical SAM protein, partial [Planctomycetota bacterium]
MPGPLVDTFGRVVRKLRLSVTDRCNFRCAYCMPMQVSWIPRAEVLSYEEMTRISRIAVTLGVQKIRITGGEPTARKDIPH